MVSNKHPVLGTKDSMTMLLYWVSLITLIASSDALPDSIMSKLSFEFATKDLDPLSYFLGLFVVHVPSRYQISNIFTKGLMLQLFGYFRDSLNIRQSRVSTTECIIILLSLLKYYYYYY